MSTLDDLRIDADREAELDRCDALHSYPMSEDVDCSGCAEKRQQRHEDDELEGEGSRHHAHVGTLHWANGWPMQTCSSCFELIDHRDCLECASDEHRGRQISETERRYAWGDS